MSENKQDNIQEIMKKQAKKGIDKIIKESQAAFEKQKVKRNLKK